MNENSVDQLKRLSDETEEGYIWRIGNLIDDGVISAWRDVVDVINAELSDGIEKRDNCAETYQKKYRIAKNNFENVFCKMLEDGNATSASLDDKLERINRERAKLNAARIEYNRNVRSESRFELFYEEIKDAIKRLPVPEFEKRSAKTKKELEYVLTLSDIHCGANFKAENNEYSLEICKKRFQKLLNDAIEFVQDKNISKLKILEMGDSVQGILRLNDLRVNEIPVVEAVVYVYRLLASFLNDLSQYVDIDYYHCPTSNHSQTRPLASKASELASEDVEYIVANCIKDTLADNKRVHIHTNFGKEYIEMKIAGHNTIAFHGHQIKGFQNALKDIQQVKQKFYTTVFLAHFHHAEDITVGETSSTNAEVIITPAFVGSCPYSDKLLKGAKASCNMYGFDKKYGHTETVSFILN